MLNNLMALNQVMRDVKLSRPELEKIIRKRLKKVIISAFRYVPHYREMMKRLGYDPIRNYRGTDDILNFPITTKEELKQKSIAAFIKEGSNISNCNVDSTSGSTGIPLRVYRSSSERALQIARWLRVLFLNGYSARDRVLSFTSPERMEEGRSILQKFGIFRRLPINYQLSPKEFVNALLAYKPNVVYGTRSCLDLASLELKKRGIKLKGIKLLLAAGEFVYESSRCNCREQFGVDIIESYGTVEMGLMGYETPHRDGIHLTEDLTYFEFLDKDGLPVQEGKPGRIVVTDLTNKIMPFIRYDQGDFGIFKEVKDSNGQMIRRLERIIGREDDFVVLPDGSKRIFNRFMNVMDRYTHIQQFRVIQKTIDHFQIQVVADLTYLANISSDLLIRLKDDWPPEVSFKIVPVERIEADPGGKIRILISELEQ